jgi:hypothetical protein
MNQLHILCSVLDVLVNPHDALAIGTMFVAGDAHDDQCPHYIGGDDMALGG